MKAKLSLIIGLLASALCLPAFAQGTAFTYQGRLNDGANVANGSYDLTFALFGVAAGGSAVAGPITNAATDVSNGLFTVTLNFGAGIFPGADRWLEISVTTNGGGAFTPLSPRQKIIPTPYTITASNVTGVVNSGSLAGTYSSAVTLNNAGNSFTGNGAGLTSLNASQLISGQVSSGVLSNAWKITGNASTTPGTHFLGTTDNKSLELRVNGVRAFLLQPNTNGGPTVIGGSRSNSVSANTAGATIGGGDQNFIQSFPAAESHFATISGGSSNFIDYFSFNAAIGGGFQNTIGPNSYYSSIGGGLQNRLDYGAAYSTIASGQSNALETFARYAVIGGGEANTIGYLAFYSIVGGGRNNAIRSNAQYSVIGGGQNNVIQTNARSSSIVGGEVNSVFADYSSIGGGSGNRIGSNATWSLIAGGTGNVISNDTVHAFIGGGDANTIQAGADRSAIGGGLFNEIHSGAQYAFIGGGDANKAKTNAEFAVMGGGSNNTIESNAQYAVLIGGQLNSIFNNGHFSTIGGGKANSIGVFAQYATIPGGGANIANGNFSFAAGVGAQALHAGSFVWNDSSGLSVPFQSTGPNQFYVHAGGGIQFVGNVGINRSAAANRLEVEGNASKTTAGSWLANSDARIKTDVQTVSGALAKLEQVRLVRFHYADDYRAAHPDIKDHEYLNVVAQEFQQVFPDDVQRSGEKLANGDDILQVDTYPLTIYSAAAIQELSQKVAQHDATLRNELKQSRMEIAELKRELEKLKQVMVNLANAKD